MNTATKQDNAKETTFITKKSLYVIYLLVLTVVAVTALTLAYTTSVRQKAIIDGVCSWSIDGDTPSEKSLCGQLQSATKTQYMCSNDTNCWIEYK